MSRIGNLSTRIFVGGLDPIVNELDLEKAFALFGDITNTMVMRDRENGRSRGFAFISFKDAQSSEEAILRMHGVEIRGRCVTVRHAERERFLDDKSQNKGGGYVRGGRGQAYGSATTRSEYGSRNMEVSKTVFVTEDDSDYSRNHSYSRRRSPSPKSHGYSRDAGKYEYRDRSPHYEDNRYRSRDDGLSSAGRRSYYEDTRDVAPSRLSPTEELTAYVYSRYQDTSPPPSLARRGADSDKYRRNETGSRSSFRSYREQNSPEKEIGKSYYNRSQDFSDEHRRSPEDFRRTKSGNSYNKDSVALNYGGFQKQDGINYRDTRKPRDFNDTRRPAVDRRSPYQDRTGGQSSNNSSWGKNTRQRTPPNSYGGWNKEVGRAGRDQRRGGNEDISQRDSRSDVSRYSKDNYNSSSRGSQGDWKSQESSAYADKDRSSTQSWKRGSTNRDFDSRKGFQRTEDRSRGPDYQKNQYRSEDRGRDRNTGTYRSSSPISRRPGPGNSDSGRGRERRY